MKHMLGIIFAFVFVVPVIAQTRIYPESQWASSISQAEFQQCLDSLSFSDDTDEAVFNTLYAKFQNDYRHHSAFVKLRFKEIDAERAAYRAANPDTLRTQKSTVLAYNDEQFAWKTLCKKLDAQFDNDVRLCLTKKQQEIWITTIQSSRRRRILPEVRQLGLIRSSTDLVSIIELIDLTPTVLDLIDPLLSEYVLALDEVLCSWENEADALQAQIMTIAYGPGGYEQKSRDRSIRLRKQIEGLAANVSDLNQQYVTRIQSVLPGQYALSFVEEVYRVEYPVLFLPSPVDLAVSAVDETIQISQEQREGINAVYEAYVLKRAEIRRQIIKGVYQWEHPRKRDLEKRRIAYKQYIVDGLDPYKAYEGHPAMKWLDKRRSLAKNTCAQLRGLFANDEFESLPLSLQLLLNW
ncbi:MAG: hypothetical protein IH984_04165 [Planctomycetes bacterium]|nr:hypothetical protein [Planctomycetota bacterium]